MFWHTIMIHVAMNLLFSYRFYNTFMIFLGRHFQWQTLLWVLWVRINLNDCVIYYISVLRELLICDSDQYVSPSVYSKQLSRIQLFPLALCGSYIVRWIYIGKVFLKFLNRVSRSYVKLAANLWIKVFLFLHHLEKFLKPAHTDKFLT